MGRAFVYGDAVNTDLLAPGQYLKLPPAELAAHCLEALDPDFASSVRPGDVVVGGRAFGIGSSREQAAVSLKLLGVSAVLATSFARTFFRNIVNVGVPAIVLPEAGEIVAGDDIAVDAEGGIVVNRTQARTYRVAPLPTNLMAMIRAGGLIPYTRERLRAA